MIQNQTSTHWVSDRRILENGVLRINQNHPEFCYRSKVIILNWCTTFNGIVRYSITNAKTKLFFTQFPTMVVLIDGVNIICNNFPLLLTNKKKTLVPFFSFLPTLGRRRKRSPQWRWELSLFFFFGSRHYYHKKQALFIADIRKSPKLTILEIVHICYLMIRSILIYDQ